MWKWPNVVRVARWEFVKGARSRMFLFMTILMPIIILAAGFAGYLGERFGGDRPMDLGLYDETGSFSALLQAADLPPAVNFVTYGSEEAPFLTGLEQGELHGYVRVTEAGLSHGQLQLLTADLRRLNVNLIQRALRNPVAEYRLSALGLDAPVVLAAAEPVNLHAQEIKDGTAADLSVAGMLVPMALAMVLIMSALLSGQMLMYGVIREKRNRVVEILLSSVSATDLLLGKIVGVGGLSLLQILLWVSAGLIAGSRFIPLGDLGITVGSLAPGLLFFFFGYFLLASMFAALGATMQEAEESSQSQGLVVMIPVIPLFFVSALMANPDAAWAVIASHIPPFIPSMVLLRMAVADVPLWQLGTTLAALLVSIALFIFIGARIFAGGILQFDKALNFKDIAKLARQPAHSK